MTEFTINPGVVLESVYFKFLVVYVFILTIVVSREKDSQSVYKNIFVRLAANFAIFVTVLQVDLIPATIASLLFTTLTFFFGDK